MKPRKVDLATYAGVKSQIEKIWKELSSGNMPCDAPWPKEKLDTFEQWKDSGAPEK
jgi:hypothetical protein